MDEKIEFRVVRLPENIAKPAINPVKPSSNATKTLVLLKSCK
jgi:hypothetical protein